MTNNTTAPGLTDEQRKAHHELKTDPDVFAAVLAGDKTHEIRYNDRGFKVGDTLRLRETRYSGESMKCQPDDYPLEYTGREVTRVISHVLDGYGLMPGWVVLSFASERAAVSPAPVFEGAHTDRVRWALSDVCREGGITSSDRLSEAFARAMHRYFGAAVSPATAESKCARCGSSTAQACNELGCFYLESGEGEPPTADERAALQKDARRYQQCRESAVARGLFETPEEYDAMVDASLRKEGREVLTGRGHNFGKKIAKDGTMYRPERASQGAAPAEAREPDGWHYRERVNGQWTEWKPCGKSTVERYKHASDMQFAPVYRGGVPADAGEAVAPDSIAALIARHAEELDRNDYAYFELAYTRQTGWMAWITDKPLQGPVLNPDRKVLARGQGATPAEACRDALSTVQGAQGGKGGEA